MKHLRKIAHSLSIITFLLMQNNAHASINHSSLNNEVKLFMKNRPVKAMIYGLWINGEPVSINALGESMTHVPATKDMHFRIGGVTETLLTTVLMQLVEQKKLSLEDKVAKWYPNLPNADLVTLKMLANGTSGYPDYVYNKQFIDAVINEPFKQWSSKKLIEYALMEAPLFKPGTNQRYSHTDYVILGNILSQETKQPIDKLFHTFILNKLAIGTTRFDLTANIPGRVLHSFSQDRKVYEDATFWNPSWTSTSGSTVSTISELGIWAQAWMKGILLSKESTQQLRAPETVGKGKNTPNLYFAMGFGVANHWLFQNPGFGGYSGIFAVLPEKNIVFIAFNTLTASEEETNPNYSMELWKRLAAELAPDYPLPQF